MFDKVTNFAGNLIHNAAMNLLGLKSAMSVYELIDEHAASNKQTAQKIKMLIKIRNNIEQTTNTGLILDKHGHPRKLPEMHIENLCRQMDSLDKGIENFSAKQKAAAFKLAWDLVQEFGADAITNAVFPLGTDEIVKKIAMEIISNIAEMMLSDSAEEAREGEGLVNGVKYLLITAFTNFIAEETMDQLSDFLAESVPEIPKNLGIIK